MNDTIEPQTRNSNYYYNLKHYKPICYSGKGVPFFLLHDQYHAALPCLIFIDLVLIAVIILVHLSAKGSKDEDFRHILVNLYILILVLITSSCLMTIFMNPGIVSQDDMELTGSRVKFCQRCNRNTVDMSHCRDCEVCVQNLDHHCGFFGKCIAGTQRFAFYGFLFFVFCGFVLLLTGVSLKLG